MDNDQNKVSQEELDAIKERVYELADLEKKHPGLVLGRCNGTNKSNIKYFSKRFGSRQKGNNCVAWLEDHGGFCNCEVIFNVLPYFEENKEHDV